MDNNSITNLDEAINERHDLSGDRSVRPNARRNDAQTEKINKVKHYENYGGKGFSKSADGASDVEPGDQRNQGLRERHEKKGSGHQRLKESNKGEAGDIIPERGYRDSNQADEDKEFHVCGLCFASFKSRNGLMVHQKTHGTKLLFKCKMCEVVMATKQSYESHERMHTKEKPYQCEQCSTSFSHKGALRTTSKRSPLRQAF